MTPAYCSIRYPKVYDMLCDEHNNLSECKETTAPVFISHSALLKPKD